ncbi:MAG TPA: class I SAM-dependent methyltransferase [Candidatus Moranbacteria bacterium]|nr:class I SAM-dependent methyltransferase [Candidatus Moranbacteria bacterium]
MDKNKKLSKAIEYGSKFIAPEVIIESLDFENGMQVANFGCGTGYFAVPIAKKICPDGIVYALDVRREKLEVIESRARIEGITNIMTKKANLEAEKGSGLRNGSVDWVVAVNMLFQNSGKDRILLEAERILGKKGKMLIIEWEEKDLPIGPDRKNKISKKDLIKIAQKNKLKIVKEIEASNFHYGLVLGK